MPDHDIKNQLLEKKLCHLPPKCPPPHGKPERLRPKSENHPPLGGPGFLGRNCVIYLQSGVPLSWKIRGAPAKV